MSNEAISSIMRWKFPRRRFMLHPAKFRGNYATRDKIEAAATFMNNRQIADTI